MQKKILSEVIEILVSKLKNVSSAIINGETKLVELEINSFEFIEIIVAYETAFDFEFDDDKIIFDAFPTVLSIAEYIESKYKG
ncbi:MAG: acyl carrier protein [Lachnospiraceae bacterium]|nr:acyl carrier protein [Lachnospiraceae bacterium]